MDCNDLPEIDGVAWRMFRDDEYGALVPLLNADSDEGGHDSHQSVDDFRRGFEDLDDFNPGTHILVAASDAGVVGYVAAVTWAELSGDQILFHAGRVDPAWKRRGVGAGLLGWVQGRLGEMTVGVEGTRTLRTTALSASTTEFMVKNGYVVTQHEANLVRPHLDDIPAIPLPEGVTVRPVDESDLRAIYEAEVEHFKDHWGASEEASTWWESFKTDPYRDMSMWQVAFDGAEIVGIVRPFIKEAENNRMGRKRGYTEEISTRRDWRGKGVASALIVRALAAQRDRGMEESGLSVHEENPHGAYRLYERHGFEFRSRLDTLDRDVA